MYNFLKSYFITLAFLGLLSLVIWFRGPEISWHAITPLQNPEQRWFFIIILWVGWLLKLIFIDTRFNPLKNIPPNLSSEAKKKLIRLQGRFAGAIEFLTKTTIIKHGKNVNLLRLPWFLVIGPKGAGKSTLLANANINFILSKNFKSGNPKTIAQSDMCDWWVTRDLVLVDIPGSYLISRKKIAAKGQTIYHFLWKHLLELILPFHRNNSIQGIVLALNLPEILKFHRQEKTQIIYDIKKCINELLDYFGKDTPIHLVITKCDLLPGFTEFFSEYSIDEITQTWGITIPARSNKESLIDVFTQRFNALIKRLNKQLIPKLHQERNTAARPYIKDFPLHIERLKESITQFLKALALPQLKLQGVYLTSGTQDTEQDQNTFVTNPQTGFDHQALQIMSTPPLLPRTYFIRQLLLQQLLVKPVFTETTTPYHKVLWQRRSIYASAIVVIAAAGLLLGHDFHQGLNKNYLIQQNLAEYQARVQKSHRQGERLIEALPLLNALREATTPAKDAFLSGFYSKKSHQTAELVYQQSLQTIVIPEIKRYFETYLQTANNQLPENIYPILKAYLMLGDQEHYQPEFVTKTLLKFMPKTTNKDAIAALSKHIHNALKENPLSVKLDKALIQNTRVLLKNQPMTTLGFVILKNNDTYAETAIDLKSVFGKSTIFTNPIHTNIPFMYTGKGFQQLTEGGELQKIVAEVLQGNWILGINNTLFTDTAAEELTNQIQSLYVSNYIDLWDRLLTNTQLQIPDNIAQINNMIRLLISNSSPLLIMLDIFKQNTAEAVVLSASPKLQNLSLLLSDATANQPGGLYGIFIGLRQLQNYLDPITTSADFRKTTFEATARRMQDPTKDAITQLHAIAETSPEPMKAWLNRIADQTWHIMVNDTSDYIQLAWQQVIMQTYHTAIENRYPFNQSSTAEVDLEQFTHFLGQPGQLSMFYQSYLKPFVVESGKKHEWRIVDNEKLAFSESIFEKYEQVASIRKAFFPNGDNKLYVPFTLHPVDLDKTMKSFTLNINGQEVRYQKNMPRLISWPGNNSLHATTVNFVTPNNKLISNVIHGNWGWFRLVTEATQTVHSRKEIILNIEVNGHKASYVLFTQGSLNPFLPINLTKFQLPEKLRT